MLKLISVILFSVLFLGVIFMQVAKPAYGEDIPATPPSVSITPTPSDTPTLPVSYYSYDLRGNISTKVLSRWIKAVNRIIPLEDVKVFAKNVKTGEIFETRTDSLGNFSFQLTEGKYTVTPKMSNYIFVPFSKMVNLNMNRNRVNFKAFQSPFEMR